MSVFVPDILRGKVAFVAGGTSGINLEIARTLAEFGAKVAVMSRSEEKVKAAVAELERLGPGAAPQVLGEDAAHGIALLEYLPPENYRLWKTELLASRADPNVPVAVANALGSIHAATLNDPKTASALGSP